MDSDVAAVASLTIGIFALIIFLLELKGKK